MMVYNSLIALSPDDSPVKGATVDEKEGQFEFRAINNSNSRESRRIVVKLKCIFIRDICPRRVKVPSPRC